MESTVNKFEAERAELDALLNSETFGRSANLTKILSFVCEKYFEGSTDEIREYDIAVHALGRSGDFDPQVDTIVRVTAHLLRKRLEQYYRTEAAKHSVHIYLPYGRYVPKFVRAVGTKTERIQFEPRDEAEIADSGLVSTVPVPAAELQPATFGDQASGPASQPREAGSGTNLFEAPAKTAHVRNWTILATVVVSLCAVVAVAWYAHVRARGTIAALQPRTQNPPLVNASSDAVHMLVGDGRAAYVDTAGQTWASDTACSGGTTESVPFRPIGGTQDPQIFLGERLGLFHCAFPVPAGIYEVHLLFAETSNLVESAREVHFSLNGGPSPDFDVVLDTGGDNIETEKIFTDVHPEDDGKIHIDFSSLDSYLNAIEIMPGTPNRMLPLRIYAGPTQFRDSAGNLWLPNRYFFGGRISHVAPNTTGLPDGPLYAGPWVGHFHYIIPVAQGDKYTVKLHFRESVFGDKAVGGGGVGSRVFDVWCNGAVILKDFDIFKEAGSEPLTKTIPHVVPTAQNKIELYFVPGTSTTSFPLLNAVEVIPE